MPGHIIQVKGKSYGTAGILQSPEDQGGAGLTRHHYEAWKDRGYFDDPVEECGGFRVRKFRPTEQSYEYYCVADVIELKSRLADAKSKSKRA